MFIKVFLILRSLYGICLKSHFFDFSITFIKDFLLFTLKKFTFQKTTSGIAPIFEHIKGVSNILVSSQT